MGYKSFTRVRVPGPTAGQDPSDVYGPGKFLQFAIHFLLSQRLEAGGSHRGALGPPPLLPPTHHP